MAVHLCGSYLLLVSRVCCVFLSVHCSLVVTFWERADLLALLCVFLLLLCYFPMWCPESGVNQVNSISSGLAAY